MTKVQKETVPATDTSTLAWASAPSSDLVTWQVYVPASPSVAEGMCTEEEESEVERVRWG